MISSVIEERIFNNNFSLEETLEFFSVDLDYTSDLLRLLDRALSELNQGAIELLLYATSCNNQLDKRYTAILTRLLIEPKIQNHNLETVVESLQFIKNPITVDNLYKACLDYPYSDEHSIPIKAMWALRDIGSTSAIDKLKLLAKSDDEHIYKKAKEQLVYLKQKGEST